MPLFPPQPPATGRQIRDFCGAKGGGMLFSDASQLASNTSTTGRVVVIGSGAIGLYVASDGRARAAMSSWSRLARRTCPVLQPNHTPQWGGTMRACRWRADDAWAARPTCGAASSWNFSPLILMAARGFQAPNGRYPMTRSHRILRPHIRTSKFRQNSRTMRTSGAASPAPAHRLARTSKCFHPLDGEAQHGGPVCPADQK